MSLQTFSTFDFLNLEYATIILRRNELGTFGFTHDKKNSITAILDGDLAPINFELSIGDKIHSVNEVPVTPYNNIDQMLRNSGSQVRLKVQRDKQLQGNIVFSKRYLKRIEKITFQH